MRPPSTYPVTLLLAVPLLAGCGADPASTDARAAEPPAEGDPVVVRTAEQTSAMDALVTGPVTERDGCLGIGDVPAVWPVGTTWRADDRVLVLPDGVEVRLGDEVTSGGGYVQPFSDGIDDPDLLRDCAGRGGEVVVVNDGVRRVD